MLCDSYDDEILCLLFMSTNLLCSLRTVISILWASLCYMLVAQYVCKMQHLPAPSVQGSFDDARTMT